MKLRSPILIAAFILLVAACGDATSVSSGGDVTPAPTASAPPTDQPPASPPADTVDPGLQTRPVGGTDSFAIADLTVVVSHPDVADITYRISCLGDTATIEQAPAFVDANQACSALLEPAVVARLVDGPPPDQVCTEIYGGPDVATFEGTLGGEAISASVDRVNGCGMFDWDEVLRALVPPPRQFTG